MDQFVQQAEKAAQGFLSEQGGQQNNQQNDNNNQQQDSNNNQEQNQNQNQGNNNNNQQGSSSGGLFGGLQQAGEDGMINTEVNKFLTQEGISAGADGAIDSFIDKEANQYLGGNKNF